MTILTLFRPLLYGEVGEKLWFSNSVVCMNTFYRSPVKMTWKSTVIIVMTLESWARAPFMWGKLWVLSVGVFKPPHKRYRQASQELLCWPCLQWTTINENLKRHDWGENLRFDMISKRYFISVILQFFYIHAFYRTLFSKKILPNLSGTDKNINTFFHRI